MALKKKIMNTCTRWHNELNPHTDRQQQQQQQKFKQKTFTFGYDSYIIIIIMGGR